MLESMKRLSAEEARARHSPLERVAALHGAERKAFLRTLPPRLRAALTVWHGRGRTGQLPPDDDWRVWLMMAGRGFGKTRAGAEWVLGLAEEAGRRIALVGPTEDEVRSVMIEGVSGILACAGPWEMPEWEPSLGRLTWPNGSRAFVYSGANPESLRGPEHDFAWCDEIAKWARAEATWDNLLFGLRRGERPRVLATTTPRPIPLLKRLIRADGVIRSGGATRDNAMLAEGFVGWVEGLYGGTRLGRQELDGAMVEDVEGSLWPRDLIERCRVRAIDIPLSPTLSPEGERELRRIAVGVDPPASVGGDACGIVVAGLGADGVGYVLEDASVAGMRPEGWARAVAAAAARWGADRVIAEANQGGAMVASVLRSAEVHLPVRLVHASRGKAARAEPVAVLFERGAAKFAGAFPELEDELAGLTIGGGYEGPGRSPDRADAMVWALTELMLKPARPEPRVRFL